MLGGRFFRDSFPNNHLWSTGVLVENTMNFDESIFCRSKNERRRLLERLTCVRASGDYPIEKCEKSYLARLFDLEFRLMGIDDILAFVECCHIRLVSGVFFDNGDLALSSLLLPQPLPLNSLGR